MDGMDGVCKGEDGGEKDNGRGNAGKPAGPGFEKGEAKKGCKSVEGGGAEITPAKLPNRGGEEEKRQENGGAEDGTGMRGKGKAFAKEERERGG